MTFITVGLQSFGDNTFWWWNWMFFCHKATKRRFADRL